MALWRDADEEPRLLLTFYLREGEPWRVLLDGRDGRFSPLQRLFLGRLARAFPEAVRREDLMRELSLEPTGLYKLVHAVRRRLADPAAVEHVGSCVSRDGQSFGFAGYRLVGVRVESREGR